MKREKGKIINCLECGKDVFSYKNIKWGYKKFCDWKCYKNYKDKQKIKKICKFCGKEFYVNKCIKDQIFCNKDCYNKYLLKDRKIIKCKWCDKEFETKKYNGRGYYKYCCQKCYIDYKRTDIVEKELICLNCNKKFKVRHKSQIEKRKFCSRSCSTKYNKWKDK